MLHARTLGFRHPRTGEAIRVQSDPPSDFRDLRSRLARTHPPDRKAPAPAETAAHAPVRAGRPHSGGNSRPRETPQHGNRRPADAPREGAPRGERPRPGRGERSRRGGPDSGMPRAAATPNRKPPSRRPAR
jgi:hypothetical protein